MNKTKIYKFFKKENLKAKLASTPHSFATNYLLFILNRDSDKTNNQHLQGLFSFTVSIFVNEKRGSDEKTILG